MILAFREFDGNEDGTISRGELEAWILLNKDDGEKWSEEKIGNLVDGADFNGDGRIQYTEFINLIIKRPDL